MTVAKVENYSAEAVAKMVADYTASPTPATVEALAKALGKSVKSVVAKLVREGVYKSKDSVTKAKRVTKADLVTKVATVLGIEPAVLASLEKGTHEALEALADAVEATNDE